MVFKKVVMTNRYFAQHAVLYNKTVWIWVGNRDEPTENYTLNLPLPCTLQSIIVSLI